jgi:hypothetical protein
VAADGNDYQLFFVVSNLIDEIYPSGLVIGDVKNPGVPEPTSIALAGLGIIGLAGFGWYRRKVA